MGYLWLKLAHVVGAILLLGNVIVTAWWKLMADRTRDPVVIRFAQRQVLWTDLVFTLGGVLLLAAAGYGNVGRGGWSMDQHWLSMGSLLFGATGAIWLAVLVPVQFAQARLTRAFVAGGPIPPRYWSLARVWAVAGILATALPLAALYFMVLKPA